MAAVTVLLTDGGSLVGDGGAVWSVIVGLAAQALVASLVARPMKRERHNLRRSMAKGIASGVGVFLSGVIVGGLANAAFASLANSSLVDRLWDFGWKPIYWLSVIGIPLAAIIGSLYGWAIACTAPRTASAKP